jgi:hypothetical protein
MDDLKEIGNRQSDKLEAVKTHINRFVNLAENPKAAQDAINLIGEISVGLMQAGQAEQAQRAEKIGNELVEYLHDMFDVAQAFGNDINDIMINNNEILNTIVGWTKEK